MTLKELKDNWRISDKTLCEYLELGFIPDISIVDGKLLFPDKIKLLVPSKNAKITIDSVVKYILRALNEFLYTDYRILLIQAEQFTAIMEQTEQNGYIKKISDEADYSSTKGFMITEQGKNKLKASRFGLDKLSFKIGFKYKAVYAELNGEIKKGDN